MASIIEIIQAAKLYHDFKTKDDYEAGRLLVAKGKKFLEENNISEAEVMNVVNLGMKIWGKIRK